MTRVAERSEKVLGQESVSPIPFMQKEVELTESSGVAEKPSTTVVTTNDHPSSPASLRTLFLRYSTRRERVLLVLGFLCEIVSFSLISSCCCFWDHVSTLLHVLRRVDEYAHHGSTGSIERRSSDFHVYSLYCHLGCSRLPREILSFCVCWCVFSIPLTSEHVTIRFRKAYVKAVLRHDVDFIENISPGRLGQRFSEESSRLVTGLGPDLGTMVRFVTSMVTGSIIGLIYVLVHK